MKRKFSCIALLAAGFYSATTFAQGFVIFGDSISDIGQNGWLFPATFKDTPDGANHLLYNQILDPNIQSSTNDGYNFAYSGGVIVGDHSPSNPPPLKSNNSGWFVGVIDKGLNGYLDTQLHLKGRINGDKVVNFEPNPSWLTKHATNPQVALKNQVNAYLAKGVNKNAEHLLWAGGNDMAYIFGMTIKRAVFAIKDIYYPSLGLGDLFTFLAGKLPPPTTTDPNTNNKLIELGWNSLEYVNTETTNTANELVNNVLTLKENGVGQLILPTIPDISITPDFKNVAKMAESLQPVLEKIPEGHPIKPLAEALSAHLPEMVEWVGSLLVAHTNNQITDALIGKAHNIVRIDSNALLNDMLTFSENYGFTNIIDKACDQSSATTACVSQKVGADGYLFTDGFHPGPLAHQIMANHIRNVVDAPKAFYLPSRILSQQGVQSTEHIYENAFISHKDGGFVNIAQNWATNNDMMFLNAGIRMTPNWQVDAQVAKGRAKIYENQTRVKDNATLVDFALSYHKNPYFFGALLGGGDGKFDLDRFNLDGNVTHLQTANFHARNLHAGLFTGYEWAFNPLNIQLSGDLTYNNISVSAFKTQGKLYEMMVHKRIQNDVTAGINFALRGKGENWQPYFNTRFTQQWLGSQNAIEVVYNQLPFTTEADHTRHYSRWNIKAGLDYYATSKPFHFGVSIARYFKDALFPQHTAFHMNMGYQF